MRLRRGQGRRQVKVTTPWRVHLLCTFPKLHTFHTVHTIHNKAAPGGAAESVSVSVLWTPFNLLRGPAEVRLLRRSA
jgi:hypothetical protein